MVLAPNGADAALEYAKTIWDSHPPKYPEGEMLEVKVARKDEPERAFCVTRVDVPQYAVEIKKSEDE